MRSRGVNIAQSKYLSKWIAVLFALLAGCQLLDAQSVVRTGALTGRVTDQSGAAVPAASIELKNLDTGVSLSALSNRSGLYRFPTLAPGPYSITARLTGFRSLQALVQIHVGTATSLDFPLRVGANTDTVTVNGPPLRPSESSASTVLDRSFLDELPLNGRKYTNFALITPNTSPDGDTGLVSFAGQQGGEDSGYANGNGANSFTVDGTNATSNYFADILGRYRVPYLYGENAIQEFQVAVSPYSALYGGGASFINTVTRSGSNTFHGNLFYYNRSSVTGANDAISKSNGFPKPKDNLQQFGAGLGGPLWRQHLWFFVDYEEQLEDDPISVINQAFAPTPENLSTYFGIPAGTNLPAPNAPYPVPSSLTAPDPTNPVYLQQVSNALNALTANLGTQPRRKDDIVVTPRLDFQATSRDSLFLSVNVNRFHSPGGVITASPVGNFGKQTLANDSVHDVQASLGWTHTFSPSLLNEFHAGTSQDNQIATPTGQASNAPTIILDSPASFTLGNAPFSVGRVFERQWSIADRVDWVFGKHTLQIGFDFSHAWDSDNNFGGADPNADVQFGSFLGSYEFSNLETFALGEYNLFSQASGNPTFAFAVPYYGFYAQDSFRALSRLTVEMGLREDFQVYPQPQENPAFALTGQYPNRLLRFAPRIGFALQANTKTVVRGGFGQFYTNMNGLNYRNAVVSNGLATQQSSVSLSYTDGPPNGQLPVFPNILPANSPLFQASPNLSLVSPALRVPYILQAGLQVEREILPETTASVGAMWNRGIHLFSGSAYDLNLNLPQGTTNYVICPAGATAAPCSGRSITLPNLDNGLLTEGRIDSNLGQINELISPGRNEYKSVYAQLQRRMSNGLALQLAYTFAKSQMRNGMDFNNQFDFSNTRGPSLLDQRHRISLAGVYRPGFKALTQSPAGRAWLSGWSLSGVAEFSSGRPFASLLSPACTSSTFSLMNCDGANDNLNDSAFNEVTSNTAAGINGAGPVPGAGLNSYYGPWIERIDSALSRSVPIREGMELQFQLQAFNLLNHANYFVQNGEGVNSLQYNPVGADCGDGSTPNQTCYLLPNSGAGNFGALEEISPNGLPRVLQLSARFKF